MKRKFGYSISLAWSKEDGSYLARIVELPGCMADGATVEESIQNVQEIARQWIETAKEEGREIPSPMSVEDYEKARKKYEREMQAHIEERVHRAIDALVPQAVRQILSELLKEPQQLKHSRFDRTNFFPEKENGPLLSR